MRRKKPTWLLFLTLGVPSIAVALLVSKTYLQGLEPFRAALTFSPKPPLVLEEDHFPCLEREAKSKPNKRYVALHGADWQIDSAINSKCLPERELAFSMEEGRQFLSHPIKRRITFWVTNKDDLIYVKIWGKTLNKQLNATALELVTNHKCKESEGKNCRIQSTWRKPP